EAAGRRPLRPCGRCVALAIPVALALLPICFTQLHADEAIWRLFQPGASQPRHPVIEARENSAWGTLGLVQLLIVTVLVAPLAEELFFRGLLLGALRRLFGLAWVAILGSALAFGIVHLGQPQDVLPLATMGLFLGYTRLRTGSLATCV